MIIFSTTEVICFDVLCHWSCITYHTFTSKNSIDVANMFYKSLAYFWQ